MRVGTLKVYVTLSAFCVLITALRWILQQRVFLCSFQSFPCSFISTKLLPFAYPVSGFGKTHLVITAAWLMPRKWDEIQTGLQTSGEGAVTSELVLNAALGRAVKIELPEILTILSGWESNTAVLSGEITKSYMMAKYTESSVGNYWHQLIRKSMQQKHTRFVTRWCIYLWHNII